MASGSRLLKDVASELPELRVDVNEQNASSRHFYLAPGFRQVGRSEIDGQGKPLPLRHFQR